MVRTPKPKQCLLPPSVDKRSPAPPPFVISGIPMQYFSPGFTDVRAVLQRSFPDLDVTLGPSVQQPDDYRYSSAATTILFLISFLN
ncbi:hypothetical protein NPIL_384871 [Nephila pilipes]|uniref:Uncharacterized protein n=1 Tax=Nephila pilipes TaxID=299642 RepID=A0A8X6QCL0_NEPPI|nr:hypothetical protein NPIL_384871 [Nephila pilipes]